MSHYHLIKHSIKHRIKYSIKYRKIRRFKHNANFKQVLNNVELNNTKTFKNAVLNIAINVVLNVPLTVSLSIVIPKCCSKRNTKHRTYCLLVVWDNQKCRYCGFASFPTKKAFFSRWKQNWIHDFSCSFCRLKFKKLNEKRQFSIQEFYRLTYVCS